MIGHGEKAEGREFIAYCRVSTQQQGRSGLGLEAQQAAIDAFLRPGDRLLTPPFVEIESGRRADRPRLREAMAKCRATGATLLVARLDRLSRNLPFLRTIIDSPLDVTFADLPSIPPGAIGRFILMQMAAVAELEGGLISERTKAALAAAKARGVRLGGDRGYRPAHGPDAAAGGRASGAVRAQSADHAAFRIADAIAETCEGGAPSLRTIAAALTARGIGAPRGGAWTATAVRRVIARAERATA